LSNFKLTEISIPIPGTEGPSSRINTDELRKLQRAEDILGSPSRNPSTTAANALAPAEEEWGKW